jgi:SAM-dependent methyltransferase
MTITEASMTPLTDVFDRDYHYFMSAFHTPEVNAQEVDLMVKAAGIGPDDVILDAPCGYGRIGLEFAGRGHRVIGVDCSEELIRTAVASAAGSTADFHVADLRNLDLATRFDVAIVWFTSFGYFADAENLEILRVLRAHLRPGGRLLLETVNPVFVYSVIHSRNGQWSIRQDLGSDMLMDRVTLDPTGARLHSDRRIVRGGQVRDCEYSLRLFSAPELTALLTSVGFGSVSLYDEKGEPFTWRATRLIAVATR